MPFSLPLERASMPEKHVSLGTKFDSCCSIAVSEWYLIFISFLLPVIVLAAHAEHQAASIIQSVEPEKRILAVS